MSALVQDDPNLHTQFVNPQDDMLQALAAMEMYESGDEALAGQLMSGMSLGRRIHALYNLNSHLLSLHAAHLNEDESEVIGRSRAALIQQSVLT